MLNRNKEILEDHERGLTFKSIAIKYGITAARCSQIVMKANNKVDENQRKEIALNKLKQQLGIKE